MTFTAGEIKNPKVNLPLSLAIGTGVVLALYVFANFVYLSVLPLVGAADATTVLGRGIQFAREDRVGTAVMEQAFGAVRRETDGGRHHDLGLRLRQRAAFSRARGSITR